MSTLAPVLGLGVRLALTGGRSRAALVVLGTAVGVAVLLLAVSVPSSVLSGSGHGGLDRDEQRLTAVVVVAIAVPVVVLLLTVSRLSAATRDRRLAALRLLGVSPLRTQIASATEAVLLAVVGTAIGALVFAVALAPAITALDRRWQQWLGPGIESDPALVTVVLFAVPLLAMVVSLAPARALRSAATGVRRSAPARRPTSWRLVPLLAGAALLGVALATRPGTDEQVPTMCFAAFLSGAILTGLGVPLAVPVGVRLLAWLMLRRWTSSGVLLAARRLQVEPAATTRVMAAMLAAVFVLVGARCVLTSWESTPQYLRGKAAATTGPQHVSVYASSSDGSPASMDVEQARSALAGVPGVRAVVDLRTLREDRPWDDHEPPHVQALVATCADVEVFVQVQGCVDGEVLRMRNETRDYIPSGPSDRVGEVVALIDAESEAGMTRVRIQVPPSDPVATYRIPAEDTNWGLPNGDQELLVPPTLPGVASALGPTSGLHLVTDGGRDTADQVRAAVAPLGLSVFAETDYEQDYTMVQGYRAILYGVGGVLLAVALLALLIAAIDRAVARRREVAALVAVGVPMRTLRTSQLLQTMLPLVLGLPLAGATGLLAGSAYLGLANNLDALPWQAAMSTTGLAALTAALAAALTLVGTGRPTTPDLLRRE